MQRRPQEKMMGAVDWKRSRRVAIGIAALMTLGTDVALGQAESLNKCQATVAKEGSKYIRAVADTIGKCLRKASTAVIEDGGAASDAGEDCARQLVKITSSANPDKTLSAKF